MIRPQGVELMPKVDLLSGLDARLEFTLRGHLPSFALLHELLVEGIRDSRYRGRVTLSPRSFPYGSGAAMPEILELEVSIKATESEIMSLFATYAYAEQSCNVLVPWESVPDYSSVDLRDLFRSSRGRHTRYLNYVVQRYAKVGFRNLGDFVGCNGRELRKIYHIPRWCTRSFNERLFRAGFAEMLELTRYGEVSSAKPS
ncbi:MAG: hypothetical protein ACHQUB_01865 [Candidatus Saccharimonadia bacterium]